MRTLGNILWHIPFLGFLQAFVVWIVGLLLTVTVVGAPIGIGLIERAKYMLAPGTRVLVSSDELNKAQNPAWKLWSAVISLIYLPVGLVFAFLHITSAIGMIFTIIGAPTGFYLLTGGGVGSALVPAGKKCVPRAVGDVLKQRKDQADVEKYFGNEATPVKKVIVEVE